jgi:hypothetical protein
MHSRSFIHILMILPLCLTPLRAAPSLVHPRTPLETFLAAVDIPTQNGNQLLRLIESSKGGDPTQPVRIRLGPGTFDLGERTLTLKPYMDLRGSGIADTRIVARGGETSSSPSVTLVPHSTVMNLEIQVRGPSLRATGIRIRSGSPRLVTVRVQVRGATREGLGVEILRDASPTLVGLSVDVEGDQTASAIALRSGPGARPRLLRTLLEARTSRGSAQGMEVASYGAPEFLDGAIKVSSHQGAVLGIRLSDHTRLCLASVQIEATGGRWNTGIQVVGRGNHLESKASTVQAIDGILGTAAYQNQGEANSLEATASQFVASSPRSCTGILAREGSGHLLFDSCHLEGKIPIQTARKVGLEWRCTTVLGEAPKIQGKLLCRSCSGVPLSACRE